MAGARTGGAGTSFKFRRLDKPEELRAAEEIQREAVGMGSEAPVGVAVLRSMLDHGGLVLGAFADIYLAGVTAGFIGWDGQGLYHYNVTTAVRPPYQNHHVGFQLGAYLREEVLRQGLPRVRSHIDPLQSHAAMLAVRRLGASPEHYHGHYFGQLDSEADRGIETDRMRLRWELVAPMTEGRLAGRFPTTEEDIARHGRSEALLETDLTAEGLRRPSAVGEASAPEAHLEIPFDLAAVREHSPAALRPWRHAVRDAFRAALDLGYRVDDFAVLNLEHERRSFYLLTKAPLPVAPPTATPLSPTSPGGPRPDGFGR